MLNCLYCFVYIATNSNNNKLLLTSSHHSYAWCIIHISMHNSHNNCQVCVTEIWQVKLRFRMVPCCPRSHNTTQLS